MTTAALPHALPASPVLAPVLEPVTAPLLEPVPDAATRLLPEGRRTAPSAAPGIRVVAAPPSAPPYDDDPAGAPVLHLVPSRPAVPGPLDDPAAGEVGTGAPALPASRPFAGRLVVGLLEVLAGVRSVTQLRRDLTPELYTALLGALGPAARPGGCRPGRQSVRSLHVQERPEGVAEVCATVRRGPRLGAVALRLEGHEGRWVCTDLQGL